MGCGSSVPQSDALFDDASTRPAGSALAVAREKQRQQALKTAGSGEIVILKAPAAGAVAAEITEDAATTIGGEDSPRESPSLCDDEGRARTPPITVSELTKRPSAEAVLVVDSSKQPCPEAVDQNAVQQYIQGVVQCAALGSQSPTQAVQQYIQGVVRGAVLRMSTLPSGTYLENKLAEAKAEYWALSNPIQATKDEDMAKEKVEEEAAATVLQARYRGQMVRRASKEDLTAKEEEKAKEKAEEEAAAIVLQARYRGQMVRRASKEDLTANHLSVDCGEALSKMRMRAGQSLFRVCCDGGLDRLLGEAAAMQQESFKANCNKDSGIAKAG